MRKFFAKRDKCQNSARKKVFIEKLTEVIAKERRAENRPDIFVRLPCAKTLNGISKRVFGKKCAKPQRQTVKRLLVSD